MRKKVLLVSLLLLLLIGMRPKRRSLPEILVTEYPILSHEQVIAGDTTTDGSYYVIAESGFVSGSPHHFIASNSFFQEGTVVFKPQKQLVVPSEPLVEVLYLWTGRVNRCWVRQEVLQPLPSLADLSKFTVEDTAVIHNILTGITQENASLVEWGLSQKVDLTQRYSWEKILKNVLMLQDQKLFTRIVERMEQDLAQADLKPYKRKSLQHNLSYAKLKNIEHRKAKDELTLFIDTMPDALVGQYSRVLLGVADSLDMTISHPNLDKSQQRRYQVGILIAPLEAGDSLVYDSLLQTLSSHRLANELSTAFYDALEKKDVKSVAYMMEKHVGHEQGLFERAIRKSFVEGDYKIARWLKKLAPEVFDQLKESLLSQLYSYSYSNCWRSSLDPKRYPPEESHIKELTRMLTKEGVDINGLVQDSRASYGGFSPIHLVAEYGDISMLAFLIDLGADVNLVAPGSQKSYIDEYAGSVVAATTPLLWALRNGKRENAEFLLTRGAKVYDVSVDPETLPLYTPRKCDVTRKRVGFNILDEVTHLYDVALFKRYEKKASVDSTHLLRAAYYGNEPLVRYLLKNYPELNTTFRDSIYTGSVQGNALTVAIIGARPSLAHNRKEMRGDALGTINTLIDAGYSVQDTSVFKSIEMPLTDLAAMHSRYDIVNLLLSRDAPLGIEPIYASMRFPNPDVNRAYLDLFLKQGEMVPYNDMALLVQKGKQDSALYRTYAELYDAKVGKKMPRPLKREVEGAIADAEKQSLGIDTVGFWVTHVMGKYRETITSKNRFGNVERWYIGRDDFPQNIVVPEKVFNIPLWLNKKSEAPTWFRHYNPILLKLFTKSLALPGVQKVLRSANEQTYFDLPFTGWDVDTLSDIVTLFLEEYERLQASAYGDSVYAVYDAFFKNPHKGFSASSAFPGSSNYLITGFWARRRLDQSEEAMVELFRTLLEVLQVGKEERDEFDEEYDDIDEH